jgi:hypothetical protein
MLSVLHALFTGAKESMHMKEARSISLHIRQLPTLEAIMVDYHACPGLVSQGNLPEGLKVHPWF